MNFQLMNYKIKLVAREIGDGSIYTFVFIRWFKIHFIC